MTQFKNKKDSKSDYDGEFTATVNGIESKDSKNSDTTTSKDQTTSNSKTGLGSNNSSGSLSNKLEANKYESDDEDKETHHNEIYDNSNTEHDEDDSSISEKNSGSKTLKTKDNLSDYGQKKQWKKENSQLGKAEGQYRQGFQDQDQYSQNKGMYRQYNQGQSNQGIQGQYDQQQHDQDKRGYQNKYGQGNSVLRTGGEGYNQQFSGQYGNQGYSHQQTESFRPSQYWNTNQSHGQYSHYENPRFSQAEQARRYDNTSSQNYQDINQHDLGKERHMGSQVDYNNNGYSNQYDAETQGNNKRSRSFESDHNIEDSWNNENFGEYSNQNRGTQSFGYNQQPSQENRVGYGSQSYGQDSYNNRGYDNYRQFDNQNLDQRNQDAEHRGYNGRKRYDFSNESRDFGGNQQYRSLGHGNDSYNSFGNEQPPYAQANRMNDNYNFGDNNLRNPYSRYGSGVPELNLRNDNHSNNKAKHPKKKNKKNRK